EDRELCRRPRLALPEERGRGPRPLPPGVSLLAPARPQGAAPRAVRPRRIPRGVLRILLHRREISASRAHARDEHRHPPRRAVPADPTGDRKSTRLNSSHVSISYAVFCLKKKTYTQSVNNPDPNSHKHKQQTLSYM